MNYKNQTRKTSRLILVLLVTLSLYLVHSEVNNSTATNTSNIDNQSIIMGSNDTNYSIVPFQNNSEDNSTPVDGIGSSPGPNNQSQAEKGQEAVNAYLSIWTNPGNTAGLDEKVVFFANYTANGTGINDGNCKVSVNQSQTLIYNTSLELYTLEKYFSEPGSYLYEISCSHISYENISLTGSISIIDLFLNDNDKDGFNVSLDCDDADPAVNPAASEILYNNIDDDCDPSTFDYLRFEVSADKQLYAPSEEVRITIIATDGSDTYFTVHTPANISYVYIFPNATYPKEEIYVLTNLSGAYSIEATNYYNNFTLEKQTGFTVVNNMVVSILLEKTSFFESESVYFDASAAGGVPPYTYLWTIDGAEKNSRSFDHSFSQPGTYTVTLVVEDAAQNKKSTSVDVDVLKEIFFEVGVKDNSTGSRLENAQVNLGGMERQTNSSGSALFRTSNGTYPLRVSMNDYKTFREDVSLLSDMVYEVSLKPSSDNPPLIIPLSPENGTEVAMGSSIDLRFKASDETTLNCTLFLSDGDGWWSEEGSQAGLEPDKKYAFSITPEQPGIIIWKVECTDTDDNSIFSRETYLNVTENRAASRKGKEDSSSRGKSGNLETTKLSSSSAGDESVITTDEKNDTVNETYNVVNNAYKLLPDFDRASPDTKRVAELLSLEKTVKESKMKLEQANRDLFNLQYKTDSVSIIETRNAIQERIDAIKDQTPTKVNVNKKVAFIKYARDEDVEQILDEYYEKKHMDTDKTDFIRANLQLQKKVSIQTEGYQIEITYMSGRKEKLTLLHKSIEFDPLFKKISLVEFIPKTIVSSSDDISFITKPVHVLETDPIVEFDAMIVKDLTYYFQKEINLDKVPTIKTLLVTTETGEGLETPTGMSLFARIGGTPGRKKLFVLEILVIIVLAAVYFSMQSGSRVLKTGIEQPIPNQETLPGIDSIREESRNLLVTGKLHKAALKFEELKVLYDKLSPSQKLVEFNALEKLSSDLTLAYLHELSDTILIAFAKGDKKLALDNYEELTKEYEKLPREMKKRIYPKCHKITSLYHED